MENVISIIIIGALLCYFFKVSLGSTGNKVVSVIASLWTLMVIVLNFIIISVLLYGVVGIDGIISNLFTFIFLFIINVCIGLKSKNGKEIIRKVFILNHGVLLILIIITLILMSFETSIHYPII